MNHKLTGAVNGIVSGYKTGGPIGAVIGGVLGIAKNQNVAGPINAVTQKALQNGRMKTPSEQMPSELPLTMDSSDMANATNFATNLLEGE